MDAGPPGHLWFGGLLCTLGHLWFGGLLCTLGHPWFGGLLCTLGHPWFGLALEALGVLDVIIHVLACLVLVSTGWLAASGLGRPARSHWLPCPLPLAPSSVLATWFLALWAPWCRL